MSSWRSKLDSFDLSLIVNNVYGKFTDYPIPEDESHRHFGDKIKMRSCKQLLGNDIFTVICMDHACGSFYSFDDRKLYSDWLDTHHIINHPNVPPQIFVASFWSTTSDGYAYDTEYQLISKVLRNKHYLKPLNEIYADKPPSVRKCGYCQIKSSDNLKLLRCSGCKILFYCSSECQRKHWRLIHKEHCKVWKTKYECKQLTEDELDYLDAMSTTKLAGITANGLSGKCKSFQAMLDERKAIKTRLRLQNEETLLFKNEDSPLCQSVNIAMSTIIEAFDSDKDQKLNYTEWTRMMREMGFTDDNYNVLALFHNCCQMSKLIPEDTDLKDFDPTDSTLLFKPVDIWGTMKLCAWLKFVDEVLFVFSSKVYVVCPHTIRTMYRNITAKKWCNFKRLEWTRQRK